MTIILSSYDRHLYLLVGHQAPAPVGPGLYPHPRLASGDILEKHRGLHPPLTASWELNTGPGYMCGSDLMLGGGKELYC